MGDQSFPPCAQEVSEGRDQITYQGANFGGLDLTVLDRNRLSEVEKTSNFQISQDPRKQTQNFSLWKFGLQQKNKLIMEFRGRHRKGRVSKKSDCGLCFVD